MFKFIVAFHVCEEVDEGPDAEGGQYESDVQDMVLCKDFVDVSLAIEQAQKKSLDWAVFEVIPEHFEITRASHQKLVPAKTVRRAVRFEKDGKTISGVE